MDKTKVNRCDDCGKRLFVSCRNCKSLHDRLAQIERQDAMLERRETLEAVGYAAIGDDGNVKGLWVLRDWDHAEVFADSCGCSLAPVFFGPQGNALAAAPQPQEGESDE